MTYDQYIKNPMGGSVVTNRQVLMDMYRQKWNNILVRENGQINYSIYKGADDFYVHLKIPSEVVPKFYYDTIARFYIDKHKTAGTLPANLNTYEVQFYSNDPSFVYTFTHAFGFTAVFAVVTLVLINVLAFAIALAWPCRFPSLSKLLTGLLLQYANIFTPRNPCPVLA